MQQSIDKRIKFGKKQPIPGNETVRLRLKFCPLTRISEEEFALP